MSLSCCLPSIGVFIMLLNVNRCMLGRFVSALPVVISTYEALRFTCVNRKVVCQYMNGCVGVIVGVGFSSISSSSVGVSVGRSSSVGVGDTVP